MQIVVKNPAVQGSFQCQLGVNKRVKDLKSLLHQNYDSRPEPSQQKLIFAGKLLQDESVLKDVLQQVCLF